MNFGASGPDRDRDGRDRAYNNRRS